MPELACPSSLEGSARTDPASLRQHLSAATGGVHRALDARYAGLVDPANRRLYHAFLVMTHASHTVLEAWLAPHLPDAVAALRPVLTQALEADIAALGLHPRSPLGTRDPQSGPPFAEPMPFSLDGAFPLNGKGGLPEAAGVVYVLDGSRLGARMILTQRRRREEERGPRLPDGPMAREAGGAGPTRQAEPTEETRRAGKLGRAGKPGRAGTLGRAGNPGEAYLRAAARPGPVFAAFDALCPALRPGDHARTTAAAQAAFKLFERACPLTLDVAS